MAESWKTIYYRWIFNVIPVYRGTGGKVEYISDDWREIRVKVPLNWRTRNYVGTIFGGSMYGAVDPMYMLMLIKLLGPDYVVWDKEAKIRFKKPGRTTLFATFRISVEEIEAIKQELESQPSIDRVFTVDLTNGNEGVIATIEKSIYKCLILQK